MTPVAAAGTGDVRVGGWLVQPSLNRMLRGATTVHLRPKLMDVLAFLAGRAGEVVPQDELLEALWARRFMAESALTRCIAELRDALEDDAAAPTYIETVTKRGYRLIAPVEWVGDPGAEAAGAPATVHDRSRRAAPAPGCTLLWGDREIALSEGENLIGRVPEAAVRVSSARVSRRHARLVVVGGRALLEDLGSKNGTFVWGRRIAAPTELADGDEICVGHDVLVFRLAYPGGTTVTDAG